MISTLPSDGDIRGLIARYVDGDVSLIDPDDDLIEFGLNSMGMIELASIWRGLGLDVNFAELAVAPTIRAWKELLRERGGPTGDNADRLRPADWSVGVRPETFDLATMQHAYWIGRKSEQALGGVAAHLYAEFDGRGIDAERLESAVTTLVERHQMLRAQFLENGQQRIPESPLVPVWSVTDLRQSTAEQVVDRLEELRHTKSHQVLAAEEGQVFDVSLTLLPEGRTRLHVDVDMLAADAMSYRTLMADLSTIYQGNSSALPSIEYQYQDYLQDHAVSVREEKEREKHWWKENLGDLPDPPALPLVPEAERVDPHLTTRRNYHVTRDQKKHLLETAHKRGLTPAVVLAAVFAEVVGRWSTSQRFLLNLPLFNREPLHEDVSRLVGDFSSSVMVTADTSTSQPFDALARSLQSSLHTSALHSAYPGLDVIRDLGRYRSEAVLAPVVYTSGLDLGELFAQNVLDEFGDPVWIVSQGPQVVLDAQVVELHGGLLVNWDVREHAFQPGVIDAMFERYSNGLDYLLAPGSDWSLPLDARLPVEQRERRIALNASSPAESRTLLHTGFFESAERTPHSPAIVDAAGPGQQVMSYGEVRDAALSVATSLRAAGLTTGDTVSVQLSKGPRQIIAVLGVLAAGGTYLPIGMDQPDSRRAEMQKIGAARFALVDDPEASEHQPIQALVFGDAVGAEALSIDQAVVTAGTEISDDQPAYVIFTSGSTGAPKGVEVSHRAVKNTLDRCREVFGVGPGDRSIALSALEFDLSIEDTFGLFDVGGSVVAIEEATRRDGQRIAALIADLGVTQLYCVPGILEMILTAGEKSDLLAALRTVVVGGDRVGVDLARRLFAAAPSVTFAGLGGCTETSIHHTVCVVPRDIPTGWTTVPFGVPLAGVQTRVVSDSGADCPDWVAGELWVGGLGVANGYRGDPDRTADRFVTADGNRWYRTGDLVRYRDDGNIEFLGRIDNQVKLRGYRIEPGEIETVLRGIEGVAEAVVEIDVRTSAARLVAVITTDSPGESAIVEAEVRADLLDRLPSYMVPEQIRVISEFPLTVNGKIDHRAILSSIASDADDLTPYVAPETALQKALALIVADVLELERVGLDDDFFLIGGDSVRGTTAVARIMEGLDTQEISVSDLFIGRNIRGLARRMLEKETVPGRLGTVAEIYLEVLEMSDAEVEMAAGLEGAELEGAGLNDD